MKRMTVFLATLVIGLSWAAADLPIKDGKLGKALILGGKARALLQGRSHVTPDDVKALAVPVLRHRILPNFKAEAEGVDADKVVEKLLETVHVP